MPDLLPTQELDLCGHGDLDDLEWRRLDNLARLQLIIYHPVVVASCGRPADGLWTANESTPQITALWTDVRRHTVRMLSGGRAIWNLIVNGHSNPARKDVSPLAPECKARSVTRRAPADASNDVPASDRISTAMDRRQSTQTISWFRDLNVRGLLDLEPPYQRRSVWNQTFKDYFIDTILLGYPAPAIFLYEEISPEGSSKYNVVDGKQRLTTIFEFADGAFPVAETAVVTRLRGKYFAELEDEDKTSFWTYQFSVEYLPTNDEEPLNSIFDRINRNVAKLS